MIDDTDTQVRTEKSVRAMMRDAFETGRASELADFVAGGGVIPSESLVQLLRSARIVRSPGGQAGPRDLPKHCAAYIVACCIDNYRNRSGMLPPRTDEKDVPLEIANDVLDVVHAHFDITDKKKKYKPSEIIGSRSTKTAAYQRLVYDEACFVVHGEMAEKLTALLDAQDKKYFPTLAPYSPPL